MVKKIDKKILVILGQTIFGLILLYVWLKYIDLGKLLEHFSAVKPQFLLIALFFALSGTFIRVVRWKIILIPIKEVPFLQLLLITFAGAFINFLIPLRAGEISKGWFLKQKYSLSLSRSIPSVLVDRGFDFFILLSLFIILPIIFFSLRDVRLIPVWWALLFLIIPAAVLYLLVMKHDVLLSLIDFLKKMLPKQLGEKLDQLSDQFLKGFSVLRRNPSTLAILVLFSLMALTADSIYFYYLFLSLGQKVVFLPVLFATILMTLTFLLPSAPGYIGTIEVAGSLVFSVVLGLEVNFAASVIAFYHLLMAFMIFIAGVAALEILHFNIFGLLKRALASANNG